MKQMNIHLVSANLMIIWMEKNESTFGDYKYNDHMDEKRMIKEMKKW